MSCTAVTSMFVAVVAMPKFTRHMGHCWLSERSALATVERVFISRMSSYAWHSHQRCAAVSSVLLSQLLQSFEQRVFCGEEEQELSSLHDDASDDDAKLDNGEDEDDGSKQQQQHQQQHQHPQHHLLLNRYCITNFIRIIFESVLVSLKPCCPVSVSTSSP